MWTAQKDWRLRQAYADYQYSSTLNDAAKQFAQLVVDANKYKLGPGNSNPYDCGISNTLMYLATGTTSWAQNVWNYEFIPGILYNPSTDGIMGESGGVGWDAAVTGITDSTHWVTNLNTFTTTPADTRIVHGRVLFLTGPLAGQHVQVTGYDGAGTITLGTPTVALSGSPTTDGTSTFQMIPYPFNSGGNNNVVDDYHNAAGFYLDFAMLLWPWFTTTQQRQLTNMFNWWADSHIGVDQTGTSNSWPAGIQSHDDNMVGEVSTLVIDQCLPGNPLKGRWLNPTNYGSTFALAPLTSSGGFDPGGTTSTTYGYADKSSYRNNDLRMALNGRGGRYVVGDEYDPGDAREAVCSMEIAQTVLGVDHYPEWRRLWADHIKWMLYAITPDKKLPLIYGDYQSTSNTASYPADRVIISATYLSRLKQVAGAVRGHPNAPHAYQFAYEWQQATGYSNDWVESYLHQDWYPVRTDWRGTWPAGYFSPGNGVLYHQNGWTSTSGCYMVSGYAEKTTTHFHICPMNVQIYRKETYAYSENIGYGLIMEYGAAQTTSPLHCGLGPMWVAGCEVADTSSNDYSYLVWGTHGNYCPPSSPAVGPTTCKFVTSATNSNANIDTFVLEGTRSVFLLPGTDGHSETILFCDRIGHQPAIAAQVGQRPGATTADSVTGTRRPGP